MSSKAKNPTPSKGQKDLFSFFKKPANNQSPPSDASKSSNGIISSQGSINLDVSGKVEDRVSPVRASTTPTTVTEGSTPRSSQVFGHKEKAAPDAMDEVISGYANQADEGSSVVTKRKFIEDDDCEAASKSQGKNLKRAKKTIIDDDEEEWNESDEESDSDSMLSDDSDDSNHLNKKRSRLSKATDSRKASKPPLPKSKAATTSATSARVSVKSSPSIQSPNVKNQMFESPLKTPIQSARESFSVMTPSPMISLKGTPESSSKNQPDNILPEGVMGRGSHEHNTFDFLRPERRCDKAGKRPQDPDYNPRTLRLPESFLKDQTPAMAQWWQFKSENMDTVLFFKVGKFYELFHMDADVGVAELDLIYMKGPKGHSGFPEVSYGKFASILVSKGYRVARIEQTETPEMLKERNDSSGKKKDKVVRRELCALMSKGTRTYCHLDDLSLLDEENNLENAESRLICILENISSHSSEPDQMDSSDSEPVVECGICCVDTVLGSIILAQFQDDTQRTRLRTFLLRYLPSEAIIHEDSVQNSSGDGALVNILQLIAPKCLLTPLRRSEAPSASDTIKIIENGKYFLSPDQAAKSSGINQKGEYPAVLTAAISGLVDDSSALLMMALGGCIKHLKRSLIDYEILSMGKMYAYVPPDEQQIKAASLSVTKAAFADKDQITALESHDDATGSSESNTVIRTMTIDAIALANLEVLVNNFDQTEKGSLWAFLNRCKTPFGRRMLKGWLCNPLFQPRDIKYRSDAVDEFLRNEILLSNEFNNILNMMKNIPDLERLLSRVHSNSLIGKCADYQDHPDNRAVMYEAHGYNVRKIKDFADILCGFESLVKIGHYFHKIHTNSSMPSKLLQTITRSKTHNGKFAYDEMEHLLVYYREIFDEKQAKRDGYICPKPGINDAYDISQQRIKSIEEEFENYLKEMKKLINVNDIKYFGNNKDRYQLEIPMNYVNKVPSSWITTSQKKTHRRYKTTWIENKFAELTQEEDRLAIAKNETSRKIFAKFDEKFNLWLDAVTCCATLDAIYSLAEVSKGPGYVWPQIQVRNPNEGSFFQVQNGRHPMLEHAMSLRGESSGYIPNTVDLGGKLASSDEYLPKLLLLTGPNMGGKSTLLRQSCLITIMAQIGCKVPADSCRLTSVDRIFTRVGASDKILAGQSTFFVELAETASILKYATEDSICILDELGRGTATFDGTAIAHAVINHLLMNNKSRVMFATHYHSLIDEWEMDPRVKLGHMDCIVDTNASSQDSNAMDVSESQADSEVTFLYKLCNGSSPRSYGINVAKLARLPQQVIEIAIQQSLAFESRMKKDQISTSHANMKVINAYFEKLVSIINSTMTIQEMAYAAREIWKRFKSLDLLP